MRILIDAHLFDENVHQGTRTYLREIYNELIKLSPDIEFYFACADVKQIKSEIHFGANVHFVEYFSKSKYFRLLIELPWMVLRYRFDYAHYQYIAPLFNFSKSIVTIHDLLFLDLPQYFPLQYRIVKNFLFKRSAIRADILLTVSLYSKKSLSKHYLINENRIAVTPNGVNLKMADVPEDKNIADFKSRYGLNRYILYVSRVEPRKNHLGLMKAYMDLRLWEEGYQLIFIGKKSIDVPELYSYWSAIDQEISHKIFHFESVSNDDLALFYATCFLFVFPSFAEGFGIPPLEAILLKAHVLCSDQTAMAEFTFLKNQLFDPSNFEQMKTRIKEALDEPLEQRKREAMKSYVIDNYSWRNSAMILRSILVPNPN